MTGEDLLRLLVRTQIHLWEAADSALRDTHDLPLARYLPMRVIEQVPDCRIQDIAEQLAITNSGASQAVDKIERSGHAQRRPNPTDRRSSVVELTASGRELLDAAAKTLDQEMRRNLKVLPETARRQMADSLEALLAPLPD
ncbi:MarR family winged helix-turn-helix transcriptional regulator [Kitasatospora sp. NBC_00315]|uniref:MarR family winged helix-turn-helix transcriptional regulator n=1 Tax=Kitasatospora sp. NBC_00315 TaxID=2975963 RepID=UPI0032486C21